MSNELISYSIFHDLVNNDKKDHKLRDIASLLLNAMNDWPTSGQQPINDFIKEVTAYFGAPLTIEKIRAKEFDGQNAWQIEAGSSICELIEFSMKFHNQSDFHKIVESCLTYYSSLVRQIS